HRSLHRITAIQEPPHLAEFLLDRLHAAEGDQLEDEAVDVPLDLSKRSIPADEAGPSLLAPFGDGPPHLAPGTSSPLPGLLSPSGGRARPWSPVTFSGLGAAPNVARQAHLGPHVAHEGAADRTLVPRRQPRFLHGLPVRRGVLPDEVPDERRLPLIAAPP